MLITITLTNTLSPNIPTYITHLFCSVPYAIFYWSKYYNKRKKSMPLTSSFYGMHINLQDFTCLLENRPFLPKTLKTFQMQLFVL